MTAVDEIRELFGGRGQDAYFGENVSQLEHALQAAALAEQANAGPSLVAAALLHDVGHLIHSLPEDIADQGIDGHHESAGAEWLGRHFGAEVTEPVRLHVDAKRYLCATDSTYRAQLSPSSLRSLGLQGGAFHSEQVRQFEQNPFCREAVLLRRWDDEAKVPGLEVPGIDHYQGLIRSLLR